MHDKDCRRRDEVRALALVRRLRRLSHAVSLRFCMLVYPIERAGLALQLERKSEKM